MTARSSTSSARARPARAARSEAPIQLCKRPRAHEDPDRTPLFTIDDIEYSMPRVVHQGDSIKWQLLLDTMDDDDVKAVTLMRLMCGDRATDALLNESTLTKGEWENLKDKITTRAFGPAEKEPEGN